MRSSPSRRGPRTLGLAALALTTAATLAACGSDGGESTSAAEATGSSRVAVSYEGGVLVLDGETLETVGDFDSEEFTRLNSAGDGRHVMVTTTEGFQVLDAGTGGGEPALTDLVFEADTPGHVTPHAGRTALYADGTSDTMLFDTDSLDAASGELPEIDTVSGTEAHHGVSIELEDGTFVTTVGNEDTRSGAEGEVIASNDECPGIHGEGTAADEVVIFGCEDGALLFADGEFEKVEAPDQPYGRMGNVWVTETSPLVVGDYKTDPDAEGYLLDQLAVIDTAAGTHEVVDLPEGVEYTFRDVARGPDDLAYLIASDGNLHVFDPQAQEITDSFPVIDAWEGPAEWQDPHPTIKVEGELAYVTEPAAQAVHAVDLTTGEVVQTAELDVEPNEIAVAAG